MNWGEPETKIQIILSIAIVICCFMGVMAFRDMSTRERDLIEQVHKLTALNDAQARLAKQQADMATVQGQTNKNLSDEIGEIRRRQDLLRRVAERIGIEAHLPEGHGRQ